MRTSLFFSVFLQMLSPHCALRLQLSKWWATSSLTGISFGSLVPFTLSWLWIEFSGVRPSVAGPLPQCVRTQAWHYKKKKRKRKREAVKMDFSCGRVRMLLLCSSDLTVLCVSLLHQSVFALLISCLQTRELWSPDSCYASSRRYDAFFVTSDALGASFLSCHGEISAGEDVLLIRGERGERRKLPLVNNG